MSVILIIPEERKLQRERSKLTMQVAIVSSQRALINLEADDQELQSIVGSLCGPHIPKSTTMMGTTLAASSKASTLVAPSSSTPIDNYFVHKNTPRAQSSLEATRWNSEAHEHANIACADFWHFNNIPFNVANNPYWFNLITTLTIIGKGYKEPSCTNLSGRLVT